MSSYIPASLRRLVTERAEGLCEYCLIHESDTFFGCQIEHIIAEKHGGPTEAANLALACIFCNRFKGTDIATLAPATRQLCRLFHPRTDRWVDHFRLDDDARIVGLTDIGQATALLLGFNHPDRILERETLIAAARYPSPGALGRMKT
jgi:hypothetical protein